MEIFLTNVQFCLTLTLILLDMNLVEFGWIWLNFLLTYFGKPSKVKNGESWDIVPTGQGPSPPYLGWDAYKKIYNIFITLLYVLDHSAHMFYQLGQICDWSRTHPPCWDNVPTFTIYYFWRLPLLVLLFFSIITFTCTATTMITYFDVNMLIFISCNCRTLDFLSQI